MPPKASTRAGQRVLAADPEPRGRDSVAFFGSLSAACFSELLKLMLALLGVTPVEATSKHSNAYPCWIGNVKCEYNGKQTKFMKIDVSHSANG